MSQKSKDRKAADEFFDTMMEEVPRKPIESEVKKAKPAFDKAFNKAYDRVLTYEERSWGEERIIRSFVHKARDHILNGYRYIGINTIPLSQYFGEGWGYFFGALERLKEGKDIDRVLERQSDILHEFSVFRATVKKHREAFDDVAKRVKRIGKGSGKLRPVFVQIAKIFD